VSNSYTETTNILLKKASMSVCSISLEPLYARRKFVMCKENNFKEECFVERRIDKATITRNHKEEMNCLEDLFYMRLT